jgi:predicted nucleic acid-binding protein
VNLTDTGPLVAIADKNDPDHVRSIAKTKTLPRSPLLTTWPWFTEAMYLLHREGGFTGQEALWQLRRKGIVVVHELPNAEADRMDALMQQYQDIPMDLDYTHNPMTSFQDAISDDSIDEFANSPWPIIPKIAE